jgi:MOSC domain-containing protein YiiM
MLGQEESMIPPLLVHAQEILGMKDHGGPDNEVVICVTTSPHY